MPAEGKLGGLALQIVAQLKDATDKAAQGSARVFHKFSGAGRDAARVFEHESYLAEEQLKIDEKDKAAADRAEEKDRKKQEKQQEKADKKERKEKERAEAKEKRAEHLRFDGRAGVGIVAGAAAAFGVSAAIDSGAEDSGDRAAKDAADAPAPEKVAGDPGTEDGAGDSGTEGDAGGSGAENGAGDSDAEDDAGDYSAEDDAGARGAVGSAGADSGNAGSVGAVSAGSEQGSALDSGSAAGAGVGGDSSTGRSDENTGALDDRPSQGSTGSDQPATGVPAGGGQQFDPAELMLPLLLSNMPDTGSADPEPDLEEGGEHGTGPGPGAQAPSVSPAPQQPGPTPWSHRPPADQAPATEPPGRPAQTPPRSVVPSSPAGTRDEGKGVVYTHAGDNVTETVSASVAAAYDRAYENKSATDAQAAYAGTEAAWADEKALARVDPNDLMSGDIITFDNGTALVRVQKTAGHPDGGTVDVIIAGELTPIAEVMADGAGELGGFAGFRRPPGIELPISVEHGVGEAVPATDDRSGDTDVPG
ncbi:hypothetical protein [Nocardia carnea]|uniref:hypothetical protein n=1 Tax=Nocardia carnea TaxID=37328 RepID=UPI002453E3D9|nr:hypothetical protein [Nocardia carnea]